MYHTVEYVKDRQVAVISLNRPDVMNSFHQEMHVELYDAMNRAAADPEVRCIVLRGNGKGFSSGADLKSVSVDEWDSFDHGAILRDTYNRLVQRMAEIEKPILGSLHGPVFGAGLSIALGCDLRIAAANAKFSMAFIKIGLMPDAGSSFYLPRLVGLGRALEMAMLGTTLDAEEAWRIGLVNRVVPDEELEQATLQLARHLAQSPTVALGQMKRVFRQSFDHSLPDVLEAEARGQTICGKTEDHREGILAFLQKRQPEFKGR